MTCRVLGFSKQAYYKQRANPVSRRDWDDAHLVDAARSIHQDDPVFGYRFITDELKAEHGIEASENRVHRLCKAHGIYSVLARKRGRWARPKEPVHDDLVRREFSAKAANELWFADITEHPTAEGKLYLCAIKDAFSGRIVGYSMDSRMKASLAVAALNNAIARRGPVGTIVHSDSENAESRLSGLPCPIGCDGRRWSVSGAPRAPDPHLRLTTCCLSCGSVGGSGAPDEALPRRRL